MLRRSASQGTEVHKKMKSEISTAIPGGLETKTAHEARLVACARTGNVQTFEELIRPVKKTVLRLGLRITGKPEDAEDVLQDSLLKAWTELDTFRGGSRFSTWMVSIAKNEALMNLRKRRCHRFLTIEDHIDDQEEIRGWNLRDPGPDPEQLLLQAEVRSLVLRAAQALSPLSRRIFLLRYLEDFSTLETARALRLSCPMVKSRAHRARHCLRLILRRNLKAGHVRPDTGGSTHRSAEHV